MKAFLFLVMAGIAVYFILVVMGTAWSFGAGGGEINIMTNEAYAAENGEAVAIQGDGNTVGYAKDRARVQLPAAPSSEWTEFFIPLAIVGLVIVLIIGNLKQSDDDWEKDPDIKEHYSYADGEKMRRQYGPD